MWNEAWELETYFMGCDHFIRLIWNEVESIYVFLSQKERHRKKRQVKQWYLLRLEKGKANCSRIEKKDSKKEFI